MLDLFLNELVAQQKSIAAVWMHALMTSRAFGVVPRNVLWIKAYNRSGGVCADMP